MKILDDANSHELYSNNVLAYGASSGIQKYRRTHSHQSEEELMNCKPASHDSVLHYFLPTANSERNLEDYMSGLIKLFCNSNEPVFGIDLTAKIPKMHKFELPDEVSTHDVSKYFEDLRLNLVQKATKTGAPDMIGHMTTALPFFHRPIAKLLTALNQNMVKTETASTFTALERNTIAMLHASFYKMPAFFYQQFAQSAEFSLGVVCTGGTIANITAMWIARNKKLGPNGDFPGISQVGLPRALQFYGYSSAVIIGSEMMHYSFKKAADILGLGEDGLYKIPVNENYQINLDLLIESLEHFKKEGILVIAIIAIAGTTESGSIDDMAEICRLGSLYSVHVHVDAAWGGPLIFSKEHSSKMAGIDLADSITIDGHKQLYTPLGIGVVLLKSPNDNDFIKKTAAYVIRNDSFDLGKFTLEGSRPASCLHLHASLNLLGKNGLSILLTRSCTLVKQMAQRLVEHPSKAFQLLHTPQTNILLFRYIPSNLISKDFDFNHHENDHLNALVIKIQKYHAEQNDGQAHGFISRTNVMFRNFRTDAFRVVIANPLTEWKHIDMIINEYVNIGLAVEKNLDYEALKRRVLSRYPFPHSNNSFWHGWPFDL